MPFKASIILLFALTSLSTFAQKKKKSQPVNNIVLAENGTTRYTIIVPEHATVYEQKAATVLQDHVMQISGAALPIVSATKYRGPYEIVIGQNERLDELALNMNYKALGEDGFTLKTDSSRIII